DKMLSKRVGKCLLHLFGQRFVKQAQFIITFDEMFDNCDSRCIPDGESLCSSPAKAADPGHRAAPGLLDPPTGPISGLLRNDGGPQRKPTP
ncbi:MAG: hypothetical protein AAGG01_00465, partial [Planctomycetota bacterium]